MIISKTPFRISFFGGGTDYPDWYHQYGGSVLAAGIDKYCYISCRYLPPFFDHKYRIVYSNIENVKEISEIQHPAVRAVLGYQQCYKGLEIHHDGDLPARSGLGSSSSFTVGLLHAVSALKGQHISQEELARQAIHVEQQLIGEHVGSQDQITAALGGFNRIRFFQDGHFSAEPVILSSQRRDELQDHLMLFFTGLQRNAPDIAKSKIDNLHKRVDELKAMGAMVDEALAILTNDPGDIGEFGKLLDQSWQLKRQLSHKVSNPMIDELYHTAKQAGALGGKLLGAGGGGFLLLFVRPELQSRVREALQQLIYVPVRFDSSGSKIVLYQPNGLG
ncbi:MAG: kinase [Gammaproteobacteria bacterium]|nr:kinase [Gammaproteobacteria bacterium]MCF6230168.1 kinase [Gammaproteobacteria bacterium]